MPFFYSIAPGANVATSGTANTEVDHLRTLTVAARPAYVTGCRVQGKGAGLTAISGIILRLFRFATPSTVGTTITPRPRDAGSVAARLTAFTAPTIGATPTLQEAFGCGAAGPGGWVAEDAEAAIALDPAGGANGNLDLMSASGTVSLNLEYGLTFKE